MTYWLIIFFGIILLSLSISNPAYNLIIRKRIKLKLINQIILRIFIFIIAIVVVFIGLYIESIN
tara:strand:+ start:41 stop:232 length:192 start_codon:yes stop_codon:yes gene_type:complete